MNQRYKWQPLCEICGKAGGQAGIHRACSIEKKRRYGSRHERGGRLTVADEKVLLREIDKIKG